MILSLVNNVTSHAIFKFFGISDSFRIKVGIDRYFRELQRRLK